MSVLLDAICQPDGIHEIRAIRCEQTPQNPAGWEIRIMPEVRPYPAIASRLAEAVAPEEDFICAGCGRDNTCNNGTACLCGEPVVKA